MSREERKRDARSVWARPAPGERRPVWSREQIVATALAIADAEGFEAVSMRRIAAELGAGTMTLYHYVRTKDELVALIGDAIMGELLVPDEELPEGWREGMAELARRTRAVFDRHPWILQHFGDGGEDSPGPNGMRHFEQTLSVVSRAGIDPEGQLELAALLDEYVFGHALHNREPNPFGEHDSAQEREMLEYFERQLEAGDFPHLQALAGDDVRGTFRRLGAVAADEQRFERGLQILLDGIGLGIERRQAGARRAAGASAP
jgi:AcrR family transcriptional regulator